MGHVQCGVSLPAKRKRKCMTSCMAVCVCVREINASCSAMQSRKDISRCHCRRCSAPIGFQLLIKIEAHWLHILPAIATIDHTQNDAQITHTHTCTQSEFDFERQQSQREKKQREKNEKDANRSGIAAILHVNTLVLRFQARPAALCCHITSSSLDIYAACLAVGRAGRGSIGLHCPPFSLRCQRSAAAREFLTCLFFFAVLFAVLLLLLARSIPNALPIPNASFCDGYGLSIFPFLYIPQLAALVGQISTANPVLRFLRLSCFA